jgi:hypothetical protein
MTKESKKKAYIRTYPKYTSCSDEEDMNMFFESLSRDQIAKVNE